MYRAWKGPFGALVNLLGRCRGDTVTSPHLPDVSDATMPTWIDASTVSFPDSPIEVTSGGTYSGLRISAADGANCVDIKTGELVIFEDCIFEHSNGFGIFAPSGTVAGYGTAAPQIEVRNCIFLGRHPTTAGAEIEKAIETANTTRLIVENCHIQRGRIYAYQHSASASAVMRIRYNVALNIDGREVDGSGNPVTTNTQIQQFFQHNGRTNIAGEFEIAWNEVWNESDDSAMEDAINLFATGGTSSNLLHVHHNLVNGAYPSDSASTSYSGGGIMLSDGPGDPAYGLAEYNVVLASANYGLAITSGSHFQLRNNRAFRTGYLPDEVTSGVNNTGPGIYIYDYGSSTAFGNHVLSDNVVRWQDDDGSGTNNYWVSFPGDDFTSSNNASYGTVIDQAFIDTEVINFRNGAAAAGVTIGASLDIGAPPAVSGNILLVRGAAGLNTSENQIITRLEGQGHTVNTTTDSTLTTTLANVYDLVIMSKTVNSGIIGTKLRNCTAPVMFWEDNQQAGTVDGPVGAIYMATIDDSAQPNTSWHGTGTQIYVDSGVASALRGGLSGAINFYSTSGDITFAPKTGGVTDLVSGAIKIAEFGSSAGGAQWALYLIEEGTTLADGTTAPAKRAYFGLDDDTFQNLTADGLTLFDAQIGWLLENTESVTPLLGAASPSNSTVTYPKMAPITSGDKYVDASVPSSGDGNSLATAYKTIQEGLSNISSGQTLVVKGGTYIIGSQITRNTNWASETKIVAYDGDRPVIDATGITANTSAIRFNGSANNETWHGFEVINVPDRGGGFDGAPVYGYQCSNVTISDFRVHDCRNGGIFFFDANDCVVKDSVVWKLGDGTSTDTNVPDNFAAAGGCDNVVFARCVAANAPDDAFDVFNSSNCLFVDCVSIDSGRYWNGNTAGDGNGFKMGSSASTNNDVIGCIAVNSRTIGFNDNAVDDNCSYLRNTAVGCATGFMTGSSSTTVAQDNIAFDNTANYTDFGPVSDTFNTWNLGITDPDFADAAGGDYSLAGTSDAIDAGISGGNLGASVTALELAKYWLAQDLT